MLRGLAIETSGQIGSIALAEDRRVVAEDTFPHGLKHAAEIVRRIDALCRGQGWAPADLRAVYVSVGPGSFTGLRIGVTLAKTLALATGAAIVAVPTVLVLARNAPPEARNVVVVLDAKRDQVYTARLARIGNSDKWAYEEAAHLDSLADVLSRSPRPVWLLGEGIPYHTRFIPEGAVGVIVTPEASWRARAAVVADIGWWMEREGLGTNADDLTPIYVRRPEAEEKLEQALSPLSLRPVI